MSVLACDRRGCENIMCDRYSNTHGYLCSECYEELASSRGVPIAQFMDSVKESDNEYMGVAWEAVIADEFKDSHHEDYSVVGEESPWE